MYDPQILIAPYGQARLVRYSRGQKGETLKNVGDFPSFRVAFKAAMKEDEMYSDLDGMRRSWLVLGIFNDRGGCLWMQMPTKWPGNQWDKKEEETDILPAMWKYSLKAQSLTW